MLNFCCVILYNEAGQFALQLALDVVIRTSCPILSCGRIQGILTLWCTCAARVTVLCPSVCYHVFCHHAQQKRNQWVWRCTGFILTQAIFVKVPHSEVMARKPSEQANMLISTGLPRPDPLALCTKEAQEATTKGVYRLPHAIYYCI